MPRFKGSPKARRAAAVLLVGIAFTNISLGVRSRHAGRLDAMDGFAAGLGVSCMLGGLAVLARERRCER